MAIGPPNLVETGPPKLVETSWEELAQAGLFWWVNRTLHLFGWAVVRETETADHDGPIIRVYPARCRFRGFTRDVEADGFKRLTAHFQSNASELVKQTEE